MRSSVWLVGPDGELPVDEAGRPVPVVRAGAQPVQRVSLEEVQAVTGRAQRCFDPASLKIVGQLATRERQRFDAATGHPLHAHPHREGVQQSEDGSLVFPRIDPAVIGRLQLRGTDKILLGRNAQRSGYFSLIAGYVDLGESFEQAFAREVLEETGRRASEITYLQSQPWPFTSSIMVGMHALTEDEDPVAATDGELIETRWLSKAELREAAVPLPAKGSIAYQLIQQWCA